MKQEEIKDKIKKTAAHEEIPHNLTPENIKEKLSKEAPASTGFHTFRLAGGFAAILTIALALGGIAHVLGQDNTDTVAETAHESTYTAANEGDSSSQPLTDEDTLAKLDSIKDYQEVYDVLKEFSSPGDIAVYEDEILTSREESAVMASSAADTGSSAAQTAAIASDDSSHSTTNLRVEGVDEGDILKTDGKYIYILSETNGLRIVEATSMEVIVTQPLESHEETVCEMYLDNNTLLIVTTGTSTELISSDSDTYRMESESGTTLYTYDITNPKKITLRGQVSQSGSYVTSRKKDNHVYLFTNYYTPIPEDKALYQEYIPSVGGALVPKDDIYIPQIHQSSDQLVISSVDINNPDAVQDKKSILSGTSLYYVSDDHIYITNSQWNTEGQITQIIGFAYKDGKITAQAAGSVKGYLNDSFSLDEHDNYLRVVTTFWSSQQDSDINGLYVLDENLKIVGKVDDLAPDETIQSARFMGDTGYFVTYRQMDPLFSVDLSDPKDPKILGELKITGFSEYLHFYSDNLLLGIGWETDPDSGDTLGLKLSMFDISDPTNVTEKHKMVIENINHSPAMDNYKTVMIDPAKNIFGFAYSGNTDGNYENAFSSYSLFSYDSAKGFTNEFTGSLDNQGDPYAALDNVRGIYIDNSFYLAANRTLTRYDMNNNYSVMEKLSW